MLVTSVDSTPQCVFADRFDFLNCAVAKSDVNTSDPGQQRMNFSRNYHLRTKRKELLLVHCAIIVHFLFHKHLFERTLVTEIRCSKAILPFLTNTHVGMTMILATQNPSSEYVVEFIASYFKESFGWRWEDGEHQLDARKQASTRESSSQVVEFLHPLRQSEACCFEFFY